MNVRRWLQCLVVFLVTLQGYYFYNIGLALFPIAGFLLLAFLCGVEKKRIRKVDGLWALGAAVISSVSILVAFTRDEGILTPKTVVVSYLGPVFALLFVSHFRGCSAALMRDIDIALLIHTTAIAVQYFGYYLLGSYPDLMVSITGEAQRYEGNGALGVIRPTGLFAEPAHYSLLVIVLVLVRTRFRLPLSPLHIIALLTVVFNFSLLGLGLLTVFLACHFLANMSHLRAKLVMAVIVLIVINLPVTQHAIDIAATRSGHLTQDLSYHDRFAAAIVYFNDLPLSARLFGTGLGNREDGVSYGSTYTYFVIHLGVILAICLFSLGVLYLRKCGATLPLLVCLGAVFLGTLMPTYMMFWMTIAALGILEKENVPSATSYRCPPAQCIGASSTGNVRVTIGEVL